MKPKIAIAGVGESERSRKSGKSPLEMGLVAARRAIADGGFEPHEVDAVLSYNDHDSVDSHTLATYLGIRPNSQKDIIGGGGCTETLIADAAGLISLGLARTVLIYRSMNGRSGLRMGGSGERSNEFTSTYGLVTPGQRFGMVATRHMYETKLTREHLGAVCMTFYAHAQLNPRAYMYGRPLTWDAYYAAPMVAGPFGLHDCCTETDEANAIIVTSVERARDSRQPAVAVDAVVARNSVRHSNQFSMDDITEVGSEHAARQLYGLSEIGPADVQVAAVYDCFSWVVLRQLEAFRLVGWGEAGEFALNGNLRIGGRLPTNTAGGMLSEGYTHGMNNVIELVRQLRGEYDGTPRQVDRNEVGLVTGWAGPSAASGMILTRDRG
jgi:acetyl-CoA acetyltransferase